MLRRRIVALGLLSPLFSCATLIEAASYNITDLGTLGVDSSAYSINAIGQIVGVYTTADAAKRAFLYKNGGMTDIGTLGGTDSYAYDINASGQIVGMSFTTANAAQHAFRYSNGEMIDLGTLGGNGTYSYANQINANGLIVGFSSLANGDVRGFQYSNGTMTGLGTLGLDSYAFAVNDNGQIAGKSEPLADPPWSTPHDHACLFGSSTVTDLHTGYGDSWANAINAKGQVVGNLKTTSVRHGFFYSDGQMTDLGPLGQGGWDTFVGDINASGQIVGALDTLDSGALHAFLYTKGTMTDLNSRIDSNSGWTLSEARGINDSGWIVGCGSQNGEPSHAILLTPTPEPSTLALLATGLASFLFVAWRRRNRSH